MQAQQDGGRDGPGEMARRRPQDDRHRQRPHPQGRPHRRADRHRRPRRARRPGRGALGQRQGPQGQHRRRHRRDRPPAARLGQLVRRVPLVDGQGARRRQRHGAPRHPDQARRRQRRPRSSPA